MPTPDGEPRHTVNEYDDAGEIDREVEANDEVCYEPESEGDSDE